ncbi:hypothetical protein L9F63_003553, partial [Diploptera punctata]
AIKLCANVSGLYRTVLHIKSSFIVEELLMLFGNRLRNRSELLMLYYSLNNHSKSYASNVTLRLVELSRGSSHRFYLSLIRSSSVKKGSYANLDFVCFETPGAAFNNQVYSIGSSIKKIVDRKTNATYDESIRMRVLGNK